MKHCKSICMLMMAMTLPGVASAQLNDSILLDNIVVTGTRHETDVRHLPMTVTTLSHDKLTEQHRSSILPTLNEQVPGLFTTSRGVLGYGVSNGAAGAFTLRGVGGSSPNASVLVLIDGMPQYAGLYGHSIADAYQTMLAERVEVLRGPASALYGSNAMGGVVNIVTRQMKEDGAKSHIRLSAGSYGTVQGELTQRVRKGKFSSIIGLNYGRTDGHRPDNTFEQYAGFLKLGYDLSEHWQAMGDVNITYFDSENPGEVSAPLIDNDQQVTRGMASVALTNRYGNSSGAIRAYYNWGHHEVNDGYNAGGSPRTTLYMHDDLMVPFEQEHISDKCVCCGKEAKYTVVWGKTDFSVVNENLTVNAVATPNEYSIYLVYNAPESQKEVVSETLPTEIKVKYGEIPTMPTYQNNGYVIVGWVYEDGTPYTVNEYKTLGNTTVKAQWEYWTGK